MDVGGYREFEPAPELTPWIECFWVQAAGANATCVLPDTCIDFVFSNSGGLQLVGTMTEPRVFAAEEDGFVGVRFRAGAARSFVGLAANEFTDKAIPLADVWGTQARSLEERLRNARTEQDAIVCLATQLAPVTEYSPIQRAIAHLTRRAGEVRLDDSCRLIGLSLRQFRRVCLEQTGVSPKQLARIARFRRLCSRIAMVREIDWSAQAAECGYYDQSHMIHDFREFSGQSPNQYAARRA